MYTEKLATPVEVRNEWAGEIELTHRQSAITEHAWGNGPPHIISRTCLGIVEDGKFKAYPGTEEQLQIAGDDLDELLAPNDQGKQAGTFRGDDVLVMHDKIVAEQKAEQERIEQERAARKAEQDRIEQETAEKLAAEKLAFEELEKDRIAREEQRRKDSDAATEAARLAKVAATTDHVAELTKGITSAATASTLK